MKSKVTLYIVILAALLLAPLALRAETATMSFTVPTQYTNGQAMPASTITGYDVQCSKWTPTGGVAGACSQFPAIVLAAAATGGVITGTVPGTGGAACFQIRTKTAISVSAWSPESCKTFAPLVPNPPGNVTVAVVFGINMAPVYKLTSTGKRSPDPAGYIALNEPCPGNVLFTYRGQSFRKVDYTKVQFWATVPDANVAAPCKAST